MLVLAHISDLHLDGSTRATERAERVRDRLWRLPGKVDALLVTGDIADHGTEAEYEEAARVLGLRDGDAPFPVLTCPGNHDSRAPYRKALLGRAAADGPVNSMHAFDDGAVLMCDSSIPGSDEGALDKETYDWIEATLDELDGSLPALLAFHHPPAAVHHPLPDTYRLRGAERLSALLERRPEISGLITGHAHTPAATTFAGRPLVVGPGVTWTLRLPWEGEQVADRDAPVGLAFHVLDDEGRLTSHFRVVT
ncbi:phosphodiesterase [Streptomyces resistomycificus]|uniref:Metallophosphoesterase n=1 Tax=Streptomyces resistomycificus TaxID=67356 RepID=A0A0L8KPM1_9ACTN|nr:phosphodiesterase [Streptomyces resistomycificus]KOG27893.1 metallophosphoesterase [Streptomyces resistomycificus]KUO02288.1 metallophosphoesterase [Streptomyces resistomycificus]